MGHIFRVGFFSFFAMISLLPLSVSAQTNDLGTWTQTGAEQEIKKWTFSLSNELRTKDQSAQMDKTEDQNIEAILLESETGC